MNPYIVDEYANGEHINNLTCDSGQLAELLYIIRNRLDHQNLKDLIAMLSGKSFTFEYNYIDSEDRQAKLLVWNLNYKGDK
jgi:hypothetical protein